MSPKQRYRLTSMLLLMIASILAAYLVVLALRENVHFFFNPLQVSQATEAIGTRIRVGGIVKEGSFIREEGLRVAFLIKDAKSIDEVEHSLRVEYTGVLPDLFREGQGIVVSGILQSPSFLIADEVLAKHDENYRPSE